MLKLNNTRRANIMANAIRKQAGFVGACFTGAVLSTILVLGTGNDSVFNKLFALAVNVSALFH